MKSSWKVAKVVDLQAEKRWALNGGPFGSKLVSRNYVEKGVPVIRGTNLSGATKFSFDDFVYVTEEKADELRANNAHPGDLVFTQRGTIGQVGLIPLNSPYDRFVISQSQMKLTVDERKVYPLFLYYYFTTEKAVHDMHSLAFSAGVPHINLGILRDFKVSLPDLPTQRKIAGILSAYDDLIENNLRRIKILEEMAQSLYREWFVHFRFPGHESAKFVDSSLGQIPKGWELKKLGQVAKIVMGLSPKGDTYNDQGDGMPLVNGPVEFSERFTKRIKWTTSPTKTCKAGDLVVCVRGSTTGKNVKSDGEYCLGRGVCSISSEHQSFVDQMFANELPTLLSMTSGSTFPSWTGPVLQSHPVISPPKTLVAEFDRMALPMSDTIQSLAFKNDNLRRTRDLLLPKLLSSHSLS
jgi:type I restriction enzyme S subunit